MLCSIDGQARQLIFRVAENNNMSITRSHLTDSMTSLTSLSTVSSLNQTNKTEVLQHLAKAIAEERCLLDKVSVCASDPRCYQSFRSFLDILDRECRTREWRLYPAVVDGFHERQWYLVDSLNDECIQHEWIEFRGQCFTKVKIREKKTPINIACLFVFPVACTKRRIDWVARSPSVRSRRRIVWRKCSRRIVPCYIWMRKTIIISTAWND